MLNNRVCKILGIKYPVIQAAMNWITNAEMVAAVSNAGGMGVLGPNGGQTTICDDPTETAERMSREIAKIRNLTDKPFAVNFLLPEAGAADPYSEALIEVLLRDKVKNLLVVGSADGDYLKRLKGLGFTVIFRCGNPTTTAAKVAESAGADILIATGFDEGGGLPLGRIGTLSIVPIICDTVSIPVIAGGGIVDARGVKASFALGAEGVYCGTRFIVSKECPASDICKQDIIETESADCIIFRTMGSFFRLTPHTLAKECLAMDEAGEPTAKIDEKVSASGVFKTGMLEGRLEVGVNNIDAAISLITDIRTCKEIVDELVSGIPQ